MKTVQHSVLQGCVCLSVAEIAEGLIEGISRFAGPSRVAAIVTFPLNGELLICDDHGLLSPYAAEIQTYFFHDKTWLAGIRNYVPNDSLIARYPQPSVEIPGVVARAVSTARIHYQAWFVERPGNCLSEGPLAKWLEYAGMRLVDESFTWHLGRYRPYRVVFANLANYVSSAVIDYIRSELWSATNANNKIDIEQIIDGILGISGTFEEGQRATGRIVFAKDGDLAQLSYVTKFPKASLPRLENWKQVQKILKTVSGTNYSLVSNGSYLLGICNKTDSLNGIIDVDFYGGRGEIRVNSKPVCSFRDGRLYSRGLWPKLDELSEVFTKLGLDNEAADLTTIVQTLAESAVRSRHGCTVLIDLNEPADIGGQLLEEPIDLHSGEQSALAASMSEVDGALRIGTNGFLYAFGCILDGRRSTKEDLSRGSRYNSALRFSESQPDCIVVVVSEDGHTSIFHEGKDRQQHPKRLHRATSRPAALQTLEKWIQERVS